MTSQRGRLIAIARHDRSHGDLEELETIDISVERGLSGDFRGASPGRQVSILSKINWDEACETLGETLPWTTRRANLLVDGLDLQDSIGAVIRISEVGLKITEECKPCSRMEAARPGLRAALGPHWRGGVLAVVVTGGQINRDDVITLEV
jgi:MOSC domain-containing protein YiiM